MSAAADGALSSAPRAARRHSFLQSEQSRGLALVSPPFLYALVLLALPILIVIAHSFWTQNYLSIDRTPTLENYRIALTEPIYRDLLLRSLYVSLLVSVITVVLAYPIAYYISFHGGRHKSLWLFLITIPFWTSYLLRVMSWKVILGYNGVLNSGLMGLGIIDEPSTALLYNTSAVVITLTHAWAAFVRSAGSTSPGESSSLNVTFRSEPSLLLPALLAVKAGTFESPVIVAPELDSPRSGWFWKLPFGTGAMPP